MDSKLDKILVKLGNLESKIDNKFEKELSSLKTEVTEIKEAAERSRIIQDRQKRGNNIVVFGLNWTGMNNKTYEIIDILKSIEINISKYNIIKIIKINKDGSDGAIIVGFNSALLRNDVLRNRTKLASNEKYKQIKIKEDLPVEIRKLRNELFPNLIKAKEKGEKAAMRYDKLLIEGNLYTLQELKQNQVKSGVKRLI